MKKLLLFAVFAPLACASPSPAPTEPVETPATTDAPSEAAPDESTDPPSDNTLVYSWREGRTRVYLPLDSAICQEDEAASPRYQVAALWKFDPDADAWTAVDVNSEGGWRIGCNAMLDLIDVFGFDLDPGTYAIAASLDGLPERGVFTVGPTECNDVALESPPPGKIATCVVGPSSAEARYVPDPAELQP